MKRKFKIVFSVLITTFFLFLALGSDDKGSKSDCPPEYEDRKCSCGQWIGCYGYDASDGLVIGSSPNLKYCRDCAEAKIHRY